METMHEARRRSRADTLPARADFTITVSWPDNDPDDIDTRLQREIPHIKLVHQVQDLRHRWLS